jgi:hypothetical protein
MDRMLELQLDEGLPIYLIPLRTPARIAALREYTDEQIEQFERTDVLDGDALEIAGGSTRPPAGASSRIDGWRTRLTGPDTVRWCLRW